MVPSEQGRLVVMKHGICRGGKENDASAEEKGENVLLYGVEVWKGAHLGQDVQGML